MGFADLRSFLDTLRQEGELAEIQTEVDPYLEIAEIHRRIIDEQGQALLFRRVRGSDYPVVTNLFGTRKRIDLAFGKDPARFVEALAKLADEILPFNLQNAWDNRSVLLQIVRLGTKTRPYNQGHWQIDSPANLDLLPILTTWKGDGGPFLTLPLVYTEHPDTGVHNVGIYRMQKYDCSATGMHFQISKGGGFHLARARDLGQVLPTNVFLGGPPAVTLAAIAPLPENIPELVLASVLLGKKVDLFRHAASRLPLLAGAEFILVGSVDPGKTRPEGPFGDHYGYYSQTHDFPVFCCSAIFRRKDAIYPATVVGKPRQEDYFLGNYIQELFAPIFPRIMPAVRSLWSYGETGYHSLAAAVVSERHKREALTSAFRILGEGQLSLTKFLLITESNIDLTDFSCVLSHILARADFHTDLYVFSNLAMDTLDYTGPRLNEGSKGVLLGLGEPIRSLPREFIGEIPRPLSQVFVFCPGCLVVSADQGCRDPLIAQSVAGFRAFSDWPLVILSDNAQATARDSASFLWHVFTRFNPASDIYANNVEMSQFHPSLSPPIVIDCRMKERYPAEVQCDDQTARLVDKRWQKYFASK